MSSTNRVHSKRWQFPKEPYFCQCRVEIDSSCDNNMRDTIQQNKTSHNEYTCRIQLKRRTVRVRGTGIRIRWWIRFRCRFQVRIYGTLVWRSGGEMAFKTPLATELCVHAVTHLKLLISETWQLQGFSRWKVGKKTVLFDGTHLFNQLLFIASCWLILKIIELYLYYL